MKKKTKGNWKKGKYAKQGEIKDTNGGKELILADIERY
jgi:hypothetical protein